MERLRTGIETVGAAKAVAKLVEAQRRKCKARPEVIERAKKRNAILWKCLLVMSDYEEYRAYKTEKKARAAAARAQRAPAVAESAPTASVVAAAPKAAEKPPAKAWAFMRNFHEAVRMSLKEQSEAVEMEEMMHARQLFVNMRRAIREHAVIEDEGAFPLLVKFGPLDVASFDKEHKEDERLAALVVSGDSESFAQRFKEYKSFCMTHLKHEEDDMMPLTQKTAAMNPERNALFAKEVMDKCSPDIDFMIGWCVEQLSRFGSSGQDANTATRVWSTGLRSACTPEQWRHWSEIIHSHCVPVVWEFLVAQFDIASTADCLPA
jgi:hypothetical protein